MAREHTDEQGREMIDDALTPRGEAMVATWDDDEAWDLFEGAMRAERK